MGAKVTTRNNCSRAEESLGTKLSTLYVQVHVSVLSYMYMYMFCISVCGGFLVGVGNFFPFFLSIAWYAMHYIFMYVYDGMCLHKLPMYTSLHKTKPHTQIIAYMYIHVCIMAVSNASLKLDISPCGVCVIEV